MAAKAHSELSEKIAKQIAQIARESVKIDVEILQFLKEDFEEIKRLAKKEGLSPAGLMLAILEGIKKGLIEGGVESFQLIRSILRRSEEEIASLEKKWRESH